MLKTKTKIRDIICFVLITAVVAIMAFVSMYEKKQDEVDAVVAVHVKGAVNSPGYYEFSYGSRVKDAVERAGGGKSSADLNELNLAKKLRDGEEIVVPSKSEVPEVDIDSEDKKINEKININTAGMDMLCKLEGIGETTAEKIIAYRDSNGKFKTIDEIKQVEGIGNAKFDKIKEKITV